LGIFASDQLPHIIQINYFTENGNKLMGRFNWVFMGLTLIGWVGAARTADLCLVKNDERILLRPVGFSDHNTHRVCRDKALGTDLSEGHHEQVIGTLWGFRSFLLRLPARRRPR